MENDNIDIYRLRKAWESMPVASERLEAENRRLAARLAAGKASSSQSELARSYDFAKRCAIVIIVLAPALKLIGIPAWISVIYAVFGIIELFIVLRFRRFILSCNYGDMPIVTAIAHCVKIIRWRWRILAIGSAMAAAVLAPMMWYLFNHDLGMFYAACVGGVIGLAVGIVKFRNQSRITARMLRNLRSALKPPSTQ